MDSMIPNFKLQFFGNGIDFTTKCNFSYCHVPVVLEKQILIHEEIWRLLLIDVEQANYFLNNVAFVFDLSSVRVVMLTSKDSRKCFVK